MSNQLENRLQIYATNHLNVLLQGLHGVGKTSIIEDVFDKMGWTYIVLNAATLDPYLDLIGAPEKETLTNANGEEIKALATVLPKHFALDQLDAIFVDELNRGKRETLNGMLELIQKKSIRGVKLHRLKVVWSAINPYDEAVSEEEQLYHVQPLDPALKDRFHIFIELPYKLNKSYLKGKYGSLAKPFINWWEELDADLKKMCSPRRLDYAIEIFKSCHILDDVFDKRLPVSALLKAISEHFSNEEKRDLIKHVNQSTVIEASHFISLENLPLFIDAIVDGSIDPKYIGSINQDYLEYYLLKSTNKNPDFIKLLREIMFKGNTSGQQIHFTDNVKSYLLSEQNKLNNIIQNHINKHYPSGMVDVVLNTIYDFYLENNEQLKVSSVVDYLSVGKYSVFEKFESDLVERHKKLYIQYSNDYKNHQTNFSNNSVFLNQIKQSFKKDSPLKMLVFGVIYTLIIQRAYHAILIDKNVNPDKFEELTGKFMLQPLNTVKEYFVNNKHFSWLPLNNSDMFDKVDDMIWKIILESKDHKDFAYCLDYEVDGIDKLIKDFDK